MRHAMRRTGLAVCALCWMLAGNAPYAYADNSSHVSEELEQAFTEAEKQEQIEPGEATVLNGTKEALGVRVTSWRDLPFQTVKRQTFDYSCGSAAVATLLTYIYGKATSEGEVFKAMFEAGNQDKIKREGFSLLDMSNYLNRHGLKTKGYKLSLNTIEKHKIPFIALINRDGYMHFVVVKSVNGPLVLVADPSKGNVLVRRDEFQKMWNGVSLVVTNHARAARALFSNEKEWSYAHPVGLPNMGEHPGLDSVSLPFPNWQIAPTNIDSFAGINSLTSNITTTIR